MHTTGDTEQSDKLPSATATDSESSPTPSGLSQSHWTHTTETLLSTPIADTTTTESSSTSKSFVKVSDGVKMAVPVDGNQEMWEKLYEKHVHKCRLC